MTEEGKFAAVYAKARGSKAFLIGLCTFVFVWLFLSATTGFDKDHGLINLILSLEASVSLAFFALIGEKQYQAIMALLSEIRALLSEVRAVLSLIKTEEDQILKEVSHDQL